MVLNVHGVKFRLTDEAQKIAREIEEKIDSYLAERFSGDEEAFVFIIKDNVSYFLPSVILEFVRQGYISVGWKVLMSCDPYALVFIPDAQWDGKDNIMNELVNERKKNSEGG